MSKDYYKILGVDKSASQDEIKKAFRKKAHEFHPDKSGGNETKFKEANEAYQALGDVKKRAQYDQFGSGFEQAGAGGASGFGGFQGGAGGSGGFGGFQGATGGVHVDMDDLGDIFGGIGDMFGFGGGRSQTRQQRASDIKVRIEISFLEAVNGVEKELSIKKKIVCDHCKGNIAEPGTKIETCKTCNGTGRVVKVQRTILGNMQVQGICDDCQGEGKIYAKKCTKCHGSGTIEGTDKFKIKIPAGIDNGETIRLTGKGEAGAKGAPAGDLYVVVSVRPDKRWERDGNNIRTEEKISFTAAALGDKIQIETVEGNVKLKIPAGTQSGTIFKLRGKGIVSLRGGRKGDHFVKIVVKTPIHLSRKQKKLLEELNLQ